MLLYTHSSSYCEDGENVASHYREDKPLISTGFFMLSSLKRLTILLIIHTIVFHSIGVQYKRKFLSAVAFCISSSQCVYVSPYVCTHAYNFCLFVCLFSFNAASERFLFCDDEYPLKLDICNITCDCIEGFLVFL